MKIVADFEKQDGSVERMFFNNVRELAENIPYFPKPGEQDAFGDTYEKCISDLETFLEDEPEGGMIYESSAAFPTPLEGRNKGVIEVSVSVRK